MIRSRLAVALLLGALLAPAFALLSAAPAAADPGIVVDDDWLDPGATTTVTLTDPTGVGFWLITVCGNADGSGSALSATEEFDFTNCHGLEAIGNGLELIGVPGGPLVASSGSYTMVEPIGPAGRTCIAGGVFPCRLLVRAFEDGGAAKLFEVTHDLVPGPIEASITGPATASPGAVFEFTATSMGWNGFPAIAICGNANAAGVPMPSLDVDNLLVRCHWPFNNSLIAGPGNEIVGGAGRLGGPNNSPGTVFSGTIEWVDPVGALTGDVTCVPNGNFPCAISFSSSENGNLFIPVDAPALPTLTPGVGSAVEGDTGTTGLSIPLTLSEAPDGPVTVDWEIVPIDAETGDVAVLSGQHTIPAGTLVDSLDVAVIGDTIDEFDESFWVRFTSPVGAVLGGFFGLGHGTIVDDDDPPQVIPRFTEAGETPGFPGFDGQARFEVELSAASEKTVSFDWTTGDLQATAGGDYIAASGTMVFPPGDVFEAAFIDLVDDEVPEPDEVFGVRTENHVNATPGGLFGAALITIIDDDEDCLPLLGPGADLRFCDLSGQTIANVELSGADLRGANLEDAVLIDVDLSGADLSSSFGIGTRLDRAQLLNVDLSDATLFDSGFEHAIFSNSTLDGADLTLAFGFGATFINTSLEFVDFSSAYLWESTIIGGSMYGADLDFALLGQSTVLPNDFGGVSLVGTTWGPETVCPDGTASGAHGDTCWRVPVGYGPIDEPPGTVTLQADLFQATVFPSFQADPADMSLQSWFGPTDFQSLGSAVFDVNGDGFDDRAYAFRTDDSPLLIGTLGYCLDLLVGPDAVYGCADLTVTNDPPPISPPASPPSSPPASGPISGVGGALAGLVPLLSGPVGLALTASGVGFIFLLGSNRASTSLERETREDDDDEPSS